MGALRYLCLGHLEADEFLILSQAEGDYFVQFAAQGGFGMRVEAVGNSYLPPHALLGVGEFDQMRELGWNGATETAEQADSPDRDVVGSPNFYLDVEVPVRHDLLAVLAVVTLRTVYGVAHPAELEYAAFSEEGVQIRFPTL